MRHRFRRCALVLVVVAGGLAQAPEPQPAPLGDPQSDIRLPNGKSQRDEILKAEHAQNMKDAAQLVEMAQQLQRDLEKNDRYVLSLVDLKKAEDIEKLARKIRARLQHN